MSKAPQDMVTQIEGQQSDAAEHSGQVMAIYGDGLPYERFGWVLRGQGLCAQLTENMLEFGKVLIVIKEHEPHGEFLNILEKDFDLTPRSAQRLMKAAAKFLSPRLQSNATALSHLGKTKLLELMSEDDDDLAELAEGGTLLGMDMDDIERMSSRELRKTLRDHRADDEAKDQVSSDQRQTIQDLQTQVEKLKHKASITTPDELDAELRDSAQEQAVHIESLVRDLLCPLLDAALENGESNRVAAQPWVTGIFDVLENTIKLARQEHLTWEDDNYQPSGIAATSAFFESGPGDDAVLVVDQ